MKKKEQVLKLEYLTVNTHVGFKSYILRMYSCSLVVFFFGSHACFMMLEIALQKNTHRHTHTLALHSAVLNECLKCMLCDLFEFTCVLVLSTSVGHRSSDWRSFAQTDFTTEKVKETFTCCLSVKVAFQC